MNLLNIFGKIIFLKKKENVNLLVFILVIKTIKLFLKMFLNPYSLEFVQALELTSVDIMKNSSDCLA